MSKLIQFPGAPQTEASRDISKTIVNGARNNVVPFKNPREERSWRSQYGGLTIEVNPFAFDTEEKYLSFIDDLGALLCAYGRLEDRT